MRSIFYDDDLEAVLGAESRSVFLAGPTARGLVRTPWRLRALELLSEAGYDGLVVIPEFCDGQFGVHAPRVFGGGVSPVPDLGARKYNVLHWETRGIERASVVLFWMLFGVPTDEHVGLPGFTTRAEVSRELARDPSRLVLGMPPEAESDAHIRYHAHAAGLHVHATLAAAVREAASRA